MSTNEREDRRERSEKSLSEAVNHAEMVLKDIVKRLEIDESKIDYYHATQLVRAEIKFSGFTIKIEAYVSINRYQAYPIYDKNAVRVVFYDRANYRDKNYKVSKKTGFVTNHCIKNIENVIEYYFVLVEQQLKAKKRETAIQKSVQRTKDRLTIEFGGENAYKKYKHLNAEIGICYAAGNESPMVEVRYHGPLKYLAQSPYLPGDYETTYKNVMPLEDGVCAFVAIRYKLDSQQSQLEKG